MVKSGDYPELENATEFRRSNGTAKMPIRRNTAGTAPAIYPTSVHPKTHWRVARTGSPIGVEADHDFLSSCSDSVYVLEDINNEF